MFCKGHFDNLEIWTYIALTRPQFHLWICSRTHYSNLLPFVFSSSRTRYSNLLSFVFSISRTRYSNLLPFVFSSSSTRYSNLLPFIFSIFTQLTVSTQVIISRNISKCFLLVHTLENSWLKVSITDNVRELASNEKSKVLYSLVN